MSPGLLEIVDDDSIRTSRWSEQPIALGFERLAFQDACFVV